MSGTVTMYSTPWCGYCHRLKGQLDREGIAYEVVDIEQHPEAADVVEQVNNGNQTVPTLVYADGSAQTNPSLAQVKEKLAAAGLLTGWRRQPSARFADGRANWRFASRSSPRSPAARQRAAVPVLDQDAARSRRRPGAPACRPRPAPSSRRG